MTWNLFSSNLLAFPHKLLHFFYTLIWAVCLMLTFKHFCYSHWSTITFTWVNFKALSPEDDNTHWVLGISRDLPHLCVSSVSFSKLAHSLCVLSQAGSVWFLMPRPALATCLQACGLHDPAWASGMNKQIDLLWSHSVISAGQAPCWVSASASVKWVSQALGSFRNLPILTA